MSLDVAAVVIQELGDYESRGRVYRAQGMSKMVANQECTWELAERVLYCIYLGIHTRKREEGKEKEKKGGLKERNEALDPSCRRWPSRTEY